MPVVSDHIMGLEVIEDAEMTSSTIQIDVHGSGTSSGIHRTILEGEDKDANSAIKLPGPNPGKRPVDDIAEIRHKDNNIPHQGIVRPEILWCLNVMEQGNNESVFYFKDQPWEGVDTGLQASESMREDKNEDKYDKLTTLIHQVAVTAVVKDERKEGNTPSTWRDEPVDFLLGRDAQVITSHGSSLELCSKNLVRVMKQLLDYYPNHLGEFRFYVAGFERIFFEFMYCYPEMKAYFNTYLMLLPKDQSLDPKLDIGSCGDEDIAELTAKGLDFGTLDTETQPCDKATAYDLVVLLRLLAPMYRVRVVPTMTSTLLSQEPYVKYDMLWLLMRSGTLVYVQLSAFDISTPESRNFESGTDRSAWIVALWRYERRGVGVVADQFTIQLWRIQYNRNSFERVTGTVTVPQFDGSKAIKTLQIVPSRLQDRFDGGELRKRLEKRGQKYMSILRNLAAHREYDDLHSGYRGQIIVDPEAYRQHADNDLEYTHIKFLMLAPIMDGGGGQKFGHLTNLTTSNSDTFPDIEEVYVLLPQWIEGFALKSKKWMIFEIDHISDGPPVPLVNQLDDELVLVSDADKESLRTVLPKGERSLAKTSDFVEGKGEGKLFLLYGPPGTGKTLTVECVANDTGRPLLNLTAQDVLGTEVDTEEGLRKWFSLADRWDAILLIDEADVFLEHRREGNLEQNTLSTIFLKTMEYYKGVLFLTTNRAGHIDDSFISRITSPIAYHPLSVETKAKIIKKFVRKFEETGTIEIEGRAEVFLAENCKELNGRQIRNVLQNAVALAEVQQRAEQRQAHQSDISSQRQRVVSVKSYHIKRAVERQKEFRLYLDSLKGKDENSRARWKQDYLVSPPQSQDR